MIERLMRELVTIETAGAPTGVDEYGEATGSSSSSRTALAWVTQSTSTELADGRQTTLTDWQVFLGPLEELSAADVVVRADGTRLEVVDAPHRARNARTNVVHHVEARCRSTVG